MRNEFRKCLDDKKLIKFKATPEMIAKELISAEYDLKRARDSMADNDAKWATVQAYYAMFHCARGLIFSKNYREKSHRCLLAALQELFIDEGEMPIDYLDCLREAMDLREDADYGYVYSADSARNTIANAQKFYDFANKYLKRK